MGTGASAESQGIRNDTPAPTQAELAQITSAILANQQQQQQAQYVPPQASVYTPPEAQIYTPPAAQVYTPPASQVAAPGITALLPQDQGAQTLAPNTLIPTPLTLSEPQASIYTPPTQQVYTPPASQVYTPEARSEPVPQDKFFTTPDHPAATAPQQTAQPPAQPAAKAEEPAAKPAELTESQRMRDYWSNESEAFSRVMSGMESGKAQLKEVEVGADEWGTPIKQLALTTGEHPGFDTLFLQPTEKPGLYQFSTYNQVAGGNIHGIVQADPKTGEYKPVADYTKQIRYTPGQGGGFFGGIADAFGDAIGSFGDIYKSLGPIAPIIGNALAPGLGSALSAAAALDEGNTTGAILSGLSAAGAYGGDAARNALAAEVSGNADLASQYSSGLGGTLAQNLPEIKTATSAAQLANALDKGNVLGAIGAGADLTGTQLPSELKTGIAGLGLAQAIASGNVPLATTLGAQFLPQQSAAPGADVGPPAPGGITSLAPQEAPADIQVAQTPQQEIPTGILSLAPDAGQTQQETPADVQVAQNTQLPPDTNAGLAQLIQAINNPESTSSYTGTQVADLSGIAGLLSDEPTDQDLAQLGVGLPEMDEEDLRQMRLLALQQDDRGMFRGEEDEQAALERALQEEEERARNARVQVSPVGPGEVGPNEPANGGTTDDIEVIDERGMFHGRNFRQIAEDELAAQQAELERQAELDRQAALEHERARQEEEEQRQRQSEEDQRRQEEAYWAARKAVDPNEPPPPLSPGEYVPVEDGTTGGIEDLIKTLPGSTETTDGGDGAFLGSYEDASDGIVGPGGEGSFPGTEEGTVGSDQTTEVTDMDDFLDAGQGEGAFPGINDGTVGSDQTNELDAGQGEGAFPGTEEGTVGSDQPGGGETGDGTGFEGVDMTGGGAGKTLGIFDQLSSATGLSPGLLKLLAGSLGLGGLGSLLGQQQPSAPAQTPYTGPLSNIQFNPATYTPYTYKPYAGGGAVGEVMNNNGYTIGVGYPEVVNAMAAGGIASLGNYSDGGRLLRGPGDGVSDSIPAMIGNRQPARLADGEFVIPARIVSEIGNGSTDAGARKLYEMMDRVQAARRKTTGKGRFATNTKADKYLPT